MKNLPIRIRLIWKLGNIWNSYTSGSLGIPIHKKIKSNPKISNFGLQVQPVDGDKKAVWDCYQTTDDCVYEKTKD